MNRQLKRILDLVRRTGDRMVVTDADGEEVYVVMGLDQYEEILEAAEHHHHHHDDEIEDDEAEIDWKPEDYGDLVATEPEEHVENVDVRHQVSNPNETDDLPDDLREAVEHDLAILEAWRKESERPTEPIEQKKSEEKPKSDDDEDRFYLEPIE